jgi:uncharacterized membrane protein YhiD involved in acid resistance
MEVTGRVVAVLGAAVLAVGVVIVLYVGGFALKKDVNNRNADIQRTSYEQQTTYRDEMVRKIQEVKAMDVQIQQSPDQAPQLQAQRRAIVDIICRDNTRISGGLDSSTAAFVHQECA